MKKIFRENGELSKPGVAAEHIGFNLRHKTQKLVCTMIVVYRVVLVLSGGPPLVFVIGSSSSGKKEWRSIDSEGKKLAKQGCALPV